MLQAVKLASGKALLAIANALSHDLYYKIIDPKAETRKRLIVARILLIVIGAAGAIVALCWASHFYRPIFTDLDSFSSRPIKGTDPSPLAPIIDHPPTEQSARGHVTVSRHNGGNR